MDAEARAFWIRFAKGTAFLAMGAAAHVWLPPSTPPPLVSDELVAVAAPAGFVPQPAQPRGGSMLALLESTADDSAGAPARSPLVPEPAPVGTSGLVGRVMVSVEKVEARSIFDRPPTQRPAQQQIAGRATAGRERTLGTQGTLRTQQPARTEDTSSTGPADGTWRDAASEGGASLPTAELQLASDALSRRSAHDALAFAKAETTTDTPHIAVNARPLLDDERMVQRVLQQYRTAYEQLDAAAAKSVWPTVDERALTHAFQQLAAQRLTFRSCGISITGTGANARCRGEAEYLPKIGSKRTYTASGEWIFDLTREQTSWRIVNATVQ